jgi:hypothetical protein
MNPREEIMRLKIFNCLMVCTLMLIMSNCSEPMNVTPDQSNNVFTPTLDIGEDSGGVRLKLVDVNTGRPVISGVAFYLADLIPVSGASDAYIPGIDFTNAPGVDSGVDGEISIAYKPGKYALIMNLPSGPILIIDAKTNKDVIITIEAGIINELGTIETQIPSEFVEK